MAPPQSLPTAQPAITFRATKQGKEEVKMSVLNICGSFSAEITKPANPLNNMPEKSIPVLRPQPPVSNVTTRIASRPVCSSKGPQTPTTMLGIGPCLNNHRVSRTGSSTQRLIGYSPGMCPLCLSVVSGPSLRECLIIRSLHHQIQKTPDCPAAQ